MQKSKIDVPPRCHGRFANEWNSRQLRKEIDPQAKLGFLWGCWKPSASNPKTRCKQVGPPKSIFKWTWIDSRDPKKHSLYWSPQNSHSNESRVGLKPCSHGMPLTYKTRRPVSYWSIGHPFWRGELERDLPSSQGKWYQASCCFSKNLQQNWFPQGILDHLSKLLFYLVLFSAVLYSETVCQVQRYKLLFQYACY